MLIDRLNTEGVSLPTSAQQSSPSSSAQNPQADKTKPQDAAIADQVLLSDQGDTALGRMARQNERQNDAAAAIRAADNGARELGQKIDALKEPLQTIVKNFPPFAPQDKERLELLRSYTSLRKEIDQLTVPPPPSVVEAQKLVPLPAPLGMDADDSQIADHLDKLDATLKDFGSFRSGLAADTGAMLRDGRFSSIFSAPKGGSYAFSAREVAESDAAQKSAEVGRQFAESVSQGVTAQYPQFLKGLS